ncbi:phage tail tube protein [Halosolutus halophilus]|uniref:phage tail tube protein n=1 Tax=Halosolutus halophilus TaxID=1552990 RepID=UPI002234F44E|nr:phage tail tube protein [Halosolutus halophilus]
MTGAGSALPVAFAIEETFMGAIVDQDSDGNPEFYVPGYNPTVEELDLQRELQRIREPDSAFPLTSLTQTIEGAVSVSFDLATDTWHDLVFSNNTIEPGLRPSGRWYFGVDLASETPQRVTLGTIVTQVQIQYQQGQNVRVSLTMLYADEADETSTEAGEFSATDVQKPSASDVYAHHGTTLTIDASTVETYLQSADLTISNIARFREGASVRPVDAVTDAVEPSLSTNATFTETSRRDLAYGGSTPASQLSEVDATLDFTNDAGTTIGYSLSLKPENYAWNDLVEAETDLSDDINWHVSDVQVV